jgi:hypothetical protein
MAKKKIEIKETEFSSDTIANHKKALSDITEKAQKFEVGEEGRGMGPTTFQEQMQEDLMRLLKILIWVIVGIVVLLISYHIVATIVERATLAQNIEELRRQRLDEIVRLIQIGVSTVLIPIVTLFLGYIFGRRSE